MRAATILPLAHMDLARDDDYLMCLAHLLSNPSYRSWWTAHGSRSQNGAHVLLDNGAAENGVPIDIEDLLRLANMIGATEIVLPDTLGQGEITKSQSFAALKWVHRNTHESQPTISTMAVPQGSTPTEWRECLRAMLEWPVRSIGISKFLTGGVFEDRLEALLSVPELLESDKEIHLLGASSLSEIVKIDEALPNRIRGVDSAISTIYTIAGEYLSSGKSRPDTEMDFVDGSYLDGTLLATNRRYWREKASGGRET